MKKKTVNTHKVRKTTRTSNTLSNIMLKSDRTEMRINTISEDEICGLHPKMRKVLEKHGIVCKTNESTGAVSIYGVDKRLPPKIQSSGKRKERYSRHTVKPPGRIVGTSSICIYNFDVVQYIPKTDMLMMKWIIYWMLVVLPKHRMLDRSFEVLVDMYENTDKYSIVVMRAIFLLFMTRVSDLQHIICCGHFPPYQFTSIKLYHLLTFILGRISNELVPSEEGGVTTYRRTYIEGMYQITESFLNLSTVDSFVYTNMVCSFVQSGGVHGRYEYLQKKYEEEKTQKLWETTPSILHGEREQTHQMTQEQLNSLESIPINKETKTTEAEDEEEHMDFGYGSFL